MTVHAVVSAATAGPPASTACLRAIEDSRVAWLADLKTLLREARRRFADVSWAVASTSNQAGEVVYGHRAILYARANAAFQARFLNPNGNARLQAIMSGSNIELPSSPPSPSADSPGLTPIQLHNTEQALFSALLELLYTATSESGELFAFLSEEQMFTQAHKAGTEGLAQDLLFAWRSKLFADVQIHLQDTTALIPDEDGPSHSDIPEASQECVFSAHRSILSVRCPYFASLLLSPYADSEATSFTLPSPPFTAVSLHYILTYIYTGTLSLNTRLMDLSIAMDVWRGAQYLGMDILLNDVEARMSDMCHSYKGCDRACRRRSARVFAFALASDVNSTKLQALSRPVVINHFGDAWDEEIGQLSYDQQKSLLTDLCTRTTAETATSAFTGICRLRSRLANERQPWADHIRAMLLPLQDRVTYIIRTNLSELVISPAFVALIDGVGFAYDVLEKLLELVVVSLTESTAPATYEVLVGKVLLREDGLHVDARARVEDARKAIIEYLRKRWINARSANAFNALENWCLKELSDELEQPVDDLLLAQAAPPVAKSRSSAGKPRLSSTKFHKLDQGDYSFATGPPSLHATVVNRTAARKSVGSNLTVRSSASANGGVKAGSTANISEQPQLAPAARVRKLPTATSAVIPVPNAAMSPLTPPQTPPPLPAADTSSASEVDSEAVHQPTLAQETNAQKAPPVILGRASASDSRPKSATSVRSTRSPANRVVAGTTSPNRVVKDADSVRPSSSHSTRSTTTQHRIATRTYEPPLPPQSAVRSVATSVGGNHKFAAASTNSIRSTSGTSSTPTGRTLPAKPSPRNEITSVASTPSSTAATSVRQRTVSASSTATVKSTQRPTGMSSPKALSAKSIRSTAGNGKTTSTSPSTPLKARPKAVVAEGVAQGKGASASAQPVNIERREQGKAKAVREAPGTTLKVGIPCVITIGASKLRGTVRYLGETFFDAGVFVGVEAVAEETDPSQDMHWNDGTVDDVRYFQLESSLNSSPAAKSLTVPQGKRARPSLISNGRSTPVGNATVITKGIFVRPNQVLYVF